MHRIARLFVALVALPLALVDAAAFASSINAHQAATAPRHTASAASQRARVIRPFTLGWRFLQADAAGAQMPEFDDSAWAQVTLPHDWAIAGTPKQDAASTGAG